MIYQHSVSFYNAIDLERITQPHKKSILRSRPDHVNFMFLGPLNPNLRSVSPGHIRLKVRPKSNPENPLQTK